MRRHLEQTAVKYSAYHSPPDCGTNGIRANILMGKSTRAASVRLNRLQMSDHQNIRRMSLHVQVVRTFFKKKNQKSLFFVFCFFLRGHVVLMIVIKTETLQSAPRNSHHLYCISKQISESISQSRPHVNTVYHKKGCGSSSSSSIDFNRV